MTAFTVQEKYYYDLLSKKHDFSADSFDVILVNAAGNAAAETVADVTPISYTNFGTRAVAIASLTNNAGTKTATVAVTDKSIDVSGGAGATYRTAYLRNVTSGRIIGHIDHGSGITLADGQSHILDFAAASHTLGP